LRDKAFAIERAAHAAHHAMKLKAILSGEIPDDGDDHAAALGWSAMFLCMVGVALEKAAMERLPNCSACGGSGSYKKALVSGEVQEKICPACKGSGKHYHP
jgi:hypothetical protein